MCDGVRAPTSVHLVKMGVARLQSTLPPHRVDAKAGRRIYAHSMHSVTDSLAFAVWENDALIRSLSLSPDTGVREDIGAPLPFEQPYWDGNCPVDMDDYGLPFHPLELGEEALRVFFGYALEGAVDPVERKAWEIPLCGRASKPQRTHRSA